MSRPDLRSQPKTTRGSTGRQPPCLFLRLFTGCSQAEADEVIVHTKTTNSCLQLLAGETDLLIVADKNGYFLTDEEGMVMIDPERGLLRTAQGAYLYVESIDSEAEDSAGFSHGEKLYLRILVNDEEKDAVSSRFYPTE